MGRPVCDVNTINVSEGMIFDSYNKLCDALDISPISNHTQQLKRISRCIEIEKVGYSKYLIKKIIKDNEISPNTSQRKIHNTLVNGKYLLPSACIIIDQINKNHGKYICSNKELMYALGMFNDIYMENGFQINEYLEGLLSFSYNCNLTLNNLIEQCIMSGLCRRKKIINKKYVILYSHDNKTLILGNDSDYNNYNNIVLEMMNKYDIKSYGQMFYTSNGKKAFRELTKELEERLGWKSSLRKYQITICDNISEQIINEIKSNNVLLCRKQMNDLSASRIRTVMQKKGQAYFDYDPFSVQTSVVGETNNLSRKGYEEYCVNLETLLNKYIKI